MRGGALVGLIATWDVEVLPQLNHSNFCPGFNVPGDLMAEATVGC